MMNPTPEQIERAEHLDAALRELLNIDTSDYNRQDHINHARELLMLRDGGVALAVTMVETMGGNVNDLSVNFLGENVLTSIDMHLRIAALMPQGI